MLLMVVVWFFLQVLLVLGAVQVTGSTPIRRMGGLVLLAAALLLPWLMPPQPLPRALMAALSLLCLVKVVQVSQHPGRWSAKLRAWHAFAPFDIERTRRVAARLDRRLLAASTAYGFVALAALAGLFALDRGLDFKMELLRLLLGLVTVYAGMDAMGGLLRVGYRFIGIAVPPLQDRPILAMSIREFWSTRWNKPVSGWLARHVFEPVSRRRGAEVGLVAGFAASALLHAWVFLVSVGWLAAVMSASFFLLQGIFVIVESFIAIRRAAPILRRAWTLGLLGMTSPMFVEPVLRVLGV